MKKDRKRYRTGYASFVALLFAGPWLGCQSNYTTTTTWNPPYKPVFPGCGIDGGGPCFPVCPESTASGDACGGPPRPVGINFNTVPPANGGTDSGSSVGNPSKDVDLQRADLQQQNLNDRAQVLTSQIQMSFGSAVQLVQLSDRVQQMSAQGQMTDEDRDAVTGSALEIAGISSDEMNNAIARQLNGDTTATDALLEKAAVNLGMSSASALRDQLLPALGVDIKN